MESLKFPIADYRDAYVFDSKLYSDEAKSFFEGLLAIFNENPDISLIINGGKADVGKINPKTMAKVPFCYLLKNAVVFKKIDGELGINGRDPQYKSWSNLSRNYVDGYKMLTYINSIFSRLLPHELQSIKNCNTTGVLSFKYYDQERSLPLRNLFLMRDFYSSVDQSTLAKRYSKEAVDKFIGTPENILTIELRKNLMKTISEEREKAKDELKMLDAELSQRRDALEKEIAAKKTELINKVNEKIKVLQEEEELMEQTYTK